MANKNKTLELALERCLIRNGRAVLFLDGALVDVSAKSFARAITDNLAANTHERTIIKRARELDALETEQTVDTKEPFTRSRILPAGRISVKPKGGRSRSGGVPEED